MSAQHLVLEVTQHQLVNAFMGMVVVILLFLICIIIYSYHSDCGGYVSPNFSD